MDVTILIMTKMTGVNVLCSFEKHFILTVPPISQEYKWLPANY